MKTNYLKFCLVIILSFVIGTVKAQSSVQKQQQDIQQRKNAMRQVFVKAKEQQAQQQAERTIEVSKQINSRPAIPQTAIQTIPQEPQSKPRRRSVLESKND